MHTPIDKELQHLCGIPDGLVIPSEFDDWDGESLIDTPADTQRRSELRAHGFSPKQIREMTPEQAQETLQNGRAAPEPSPPTGNGETPSAADPPAERPAPGNGTPSVSAPADNGEAPSADPPPLSQLFDPAAYRRAQDAAVPTDTWDDARKLLAQAVPWPQGQFENDQWNGEDASILIECRIVGGALLSYAVKTPDQFFRRLGHCKTLKADIWFCTSLQQDDIRVSESGNKWPRRGADLARARNTLCADLDVKPGAYANIEEAREDLERFIDHYKLPPPNALVISGTGVHAYWFSPERMTIEEWRPYAEGLKALGQEFELKADFGVTTDPVRILRVPGTLNYKTDPPRPVRLLTLEGTTDFEKDLAVLREAGLAEPPKKTRKSKPNPVPKIEVPEEFLADYDGSSLGDGIAPYDNTPLLLEPLALNCPFIKTALLTGGKDFKEPLWNMTTLIATFLEDGPTLAHALGNQHPDYDREDTEKKYAEKLKARQDGVGWPSCEAIKDRGSALCATCPHLVEGKSPLHLTQPALPALSSPATGAPTGSEPVITGLAGVSSGAPTPKPPLIVELGTRLWGSPSVNGQEYRFGADQSKVIDPRRSYWFDFTTMKGGYIRDLMKQVEAAAKRAHPTADDVVLVRAADVVPRSLDWVWEGHLLRGSQELLSGLPDLSKSTAQIYLIACVTARVPWPDGAPAIEPMNVVMLTAEDTLDQIVVPRLIAAGPISAE
jgi:hypothetical protein